MARSGFVYNGYGYQIDVAEWITKPGRCEKNICPLQNGYDYRGNPICESTLISHACKHVVYGSPYEKERYSEAVSLNKKDSFIPPEIRSKEDDVIKNYKELSLQLLKEPVSISLSGEGKKILIVCNGMGKLDGLIDILSFEPLPQGDKEPRCIRSSNECRGLGLISSYFINAHYDAFVMYRLVHQRYFEKRKQGKNIAPTVIRKEYYEQSINDFPLVDMAFDQGRLYFRNKEDGNYSFGVMFYFFWENNVKSGHLHLLYDKTAPIFLQYQKSSDLFQEWYSEKDTKKALKDIIKIDEHVYFARTLLEYIRIIAGPDFDPEMNVWYDKELEMKALPLLTACMKNNTGSILSEQKSIQYEMILQWQLLERIGNVLESHYKGLITKIAAIIAENEQHDDAIGYVADFASYAIANHLMEYYVVSYVFCHNYQTVYKSDTNQSDTIQSDICEKIKKWNANYEECKRILQGRLFKEWCIIFRDLLHVDKTLPILCHPEPDTKNVI